MESSFIYLFSFQIMYESPFKKKEILLRLVLWSRVTYIQFQTYILLNFRSIYNIAYTLSIYFGQKKGEKTMCL